MFGVGAINYFDANTSVKKYAPVCEVAASDILSLRQGKELYSTAYCYADETHLVVELR